MTMKNYISQTEYAARSLIDLIAADNKAIASAKSNLRNATAKFDIQHQIFVANEFHTAANHYHAQMARAHQTKTVVDADVESLAASIDAKSVSISALSGALLQVAKQGLSLVYGRPQNTPEGAEIFGLKVRDIIWEGRNQSIHYENPKEISDRVVNLFREIDVVRDDGMSWDPRSRYNYAFDIVNFLGWLDWKRFEDHMLSIRRGS